MPKKVEQKITLSLDQFFTLLRDSSFDRPAAFFAYADLVGIKKPRELLMHGDMDDETSPAEAKEIKKERTHLKKVFGGTIPASLLSNDWDT